MPSTKDPGQVDVGAGKLHSNVATAAADFQTSSGTSSLLASALAALNQELVVPTLSIVTVSAGDSSTTLSGTTNPIWMGDNPSDPILSLFRVVINGTDNEPTDASGAPVQVISVTGPSIGSGWYTGASCQLNFSTPIAAGQSYQVYYGIRATLQSIPIDALTFPTVKNSVRVASDLQYVLLGLHGGSAPKWSDAWLSTITDLTKSGLNERYRLSTTGGSGTVDTPGAGAIITRDGPAPSVYSNAALTFLYPNVSSDPLAAHFKTRAGVPTTDSTFNRENYDGGTGYVGVLSQRLSGSSTMKLNAQAFTQASRMDVIERYFSLATIGTANVLTRVSPINATGILNPAGGTGYNDRREIQLGASDYFWESISGNKRSEVAVGRDMLEVTYPDNSQQVFIITELNPANAQRAFLMNLTGGGASFPSGVPTAGIKFRFIKTKYWQGCGSQQYVRDLGVIPASQHIKLGHFYHAIAPFVTDDITQSGESEEIGQAEFYARGKTIGSTGVTGLTEKPYALKWGGYNPETWEQEAQGGLRGDGTVEATLFSQKVHTVSVTSSGATVIDWHPSLQGSVLVVDVDHASPGVAAITINIDISDYAIQQMKPGDSIQVYVQNPTNAPIVGHSETPGATYTLTWNGVFSFESGTNPGGQPIIFNSNSRRTINKWVATYTGLDSDFIMRDETHYIGVGD